MSTPTSTRDYITRNLQTAESALTSAAGMIHGEEGKGFTQDDYTRICQLRNAVGAFLDDVQHRP